MFDQLLRGRFAAGRRVFDAGCGAGRNLVYLIRQGFEVCGNDASPAALAQVRALAEALAPGRMHEFLVDAAAIEDWTTRLGGALIDPIKTTIVHDQRSMTTWVARMGES